MKKVILISSLVFSSFLGFTQWTGYPLDNIPVARTQSGGFTIGDTGFLVAGNHGWPGAYVQETWKFVPSAPAGSRWKQIVGYPGTTPQATVAFAIDDTGYAGTGATGGYVYGNAFYKYKNNTWTAIAPLPGGTRCEAFAFTVGDTAYVGGGFSGTNNAPQRDFYKYYPKLNKWWKVNGTCPVLGMDCGAFAFSIGTKGYVGGGGLQTGPGAQSYGPQSTFWEYDNTTNTWTSKANYGGGPRMNASAWASCDRGFVGNGVDDANQQNYHTDFWEYDPTADKWTQIASYPSNPRSSASTFVVNKVAYVWDGNDASGYFADIWSYNPPPLFDPSNASVCEGNSVNFTDTTKEFTPTNWQWTFSGGTPATSNAQNPTVNYPTAGNYDVTLSAWNACDSGYTKYTSYISVTPGPTITVTPVNPSICSGNPVTLTALGATSFKWLGTTNTTNTIQLSPSSDTVVNLASSNGGCTSDSAIKITVTPTPVPVVSSSTVICAGNTTNLLASGGASFTWAPAIGLNSANIAGPIAGPANTTTYTVTVANGICQATGNVTVTVNPLPSVGAFIHYVTPPVVNG